MVPQNARRKACRRSFDFRGNGNVAPDTSPERPGRNSVTTKSIYLIALAPMWLLTIQACRGEDRSRPEFFNGKNLDGWEGLSHLWSVKDGAIVGTAPPEGLKFNTFLCTKQPYKDFELQFKIRLREGKGNSGVQIRSRYDHSASWLDGPQVDINPPGPWRTGMMWDETRDNLRWIFPDLPLGEWVDPSMAAPGLLFFYSDNSPAWNDLQITAIGTKVTAVLNGVPVDVMAAGG